MNPEDLLDMASKAIEHRPLTAADKYHVCFWQGRIQCLPVTHWCQQHPIFLVLSSLELTAGLSTAQWDELSTKLARFWLEVKT